MEQSSHAISIANQFLIFALIKELVQNGLLRKENVEDITQQALLLLEERQWSLPVDDHVFEHARKIILEAGQNI